MDKRNTSKKLIHATNELLLQYEEKEKRAAELITANKELAFQNEEKERRAAELIKANEELKKMLKEMMFMTSHKIRQPIGHILGISNVIGDKLIESPDELIKMIGYIKQSALSLDNLTRELTTFIHEQELKVDNRSSNQDA